MAVSKWTSIDEMEAYNQANKTNITNSSISTEKSLSLHNADNPKTFHTTIRELLLTSKGTESSVTTFFKKILLNIGLAREI